jgi:hypothetical protein
MINREELIRDAAKDFLCETQYMVDNVAMAFVEGARWADENQPSPWISTDDFLPKIINNGGYSDIVLVIDENNNIELAIYSFYRGTWILAYGNDDIDNSIIKNDITHWMMIPKILN